MAKDEQDYEEMIELYLEKQDVIYDEQVVPQLELINKNLEKIIQLLSRSQASPS